MKSSLTAALLVLLTGLGGCAPKIVTRLEDSSHAALPPDAPVLVLSVYDPAPGSCTPVGTVRLGDNGFSVNCGLDRLLGEAQARARLAGANVVKLTEVIAPDVTSTCYRVRAQLLVTPDLKALETSLQRQREQASKSRLPPGTPYALLYVYRPAGGEATAVGYDLHLNDSVVFRLRHNSGTVIRLPKPGAVVLWTQANSPRLTLDVEPGKEYFLRCDVLPGGFSARPWLGFVGTAQGRQEYDAIRQP